MSTVSLEAEVKFKNGDQAEKLVAFLSSYGFENGADNDFEMEESLLKSLSLDSSLGGGRGSAGKERPGSWGALWNTHTRKAIEWELGKAQKSNPCFDTSGTGGRDDASSDGVGRRPTASLLEGLRTLPTVEGQEMRCHVPSAPAHVPTPRTHRN